MRRWPASLSWPVAAAAPSALDEVTVSTSIPLGARSTNTMGVPRSISEKRWLWFLLRSVSTILRHLPSEFSVAPPRFRQFRRSWSSVHKALRVRGVCLEEHDLPGIDHVRGMSVVDRLRVGVVVRCVGLEWVLSTPSVDEREIPQL